MIIRTVVIGITLAVSLASVAPASAAPLSQSSWRPIALAGYKLSQKEPIFIRFGNNGQVNGKAGCNNFGGKYHVDKKRIRFGRLHTTRKACVPYLMQAERAFLQALSSARSFTSSGNTLILTSTSGKQVMQLVRQ